MTSKLTQFINQILKEKKHAQKNAQMYKGLYHGLFPSTYIHVDYKDWMKVVDELRKLRKDNKHWGNYQNAMALGCDIDDIPWDGGNYDFKEIAKRLAEYKQLKQKVHNTDYATLHAGCTIGFPDCLSCKIQRILKMAGSRIILSVVSGLFSFFVLFILHCTRFLDFNFHNQEKYYLYIVFFVY